MKINSWAKRFLVPARCLALTLLCSSAALAQQTATEPKPEDTTTLHVNETVVVTATRTEMDIEKAPVSTSVVGQQEMQIRNTQSLDQSLDLLGGVYALRRKGPADTRPSVFMRGFNGANRTLVLLDGQPVNDAYTGEVTWTSLPISEVDHVEVVRGPFSSLYGGNAMGGVINILTRRVERREFEVMGQYGTYDTENYSARYADRFFDRLGFSAGYQRLQSGGYQTNAITTAATTGTTGVRVVGVIPTLTTSGTRTFQIGWAGNNWYDQDAFRVKGDYIFSSSTRVSTQYLRQRSAYGYDAYTSNLRDEAGNIVDRGPVLFDDGGVTRGLSFTPGTFLSGPGQARSHFVNATVEHRINERHQLSAAAGMYDQPDNGYRTPTAATAVLGGGPGSISQRTSRNYYANAQYRWQPSNRHDLVVGADTRQDRANNQEFSQSNWTDPKDRLSQTYASKGQTFSQAAYAQDQFRVGEKLTVTAGARYDYWRTHDGLSNSYVAAAPLTTYPERTSHALTGKVSGVYQPSGDWTLRTSTGTAFRNPTVYELYRSYRLVSTLYLANPNLEPERLFSVEFGCVKRFGTRLTLDATYYRNRTTNLIYRKTDLDADPTGLTRINVNAGEGITNGLEVSARERLTAWLEFRSSYSYTHAIISRNPAVPASEGKHVPYTPEHMAAGSFVMAHEKWAGSLSARYVSAPFSLDTNADTTKGVPGSYSPYFLADVSLAYQFHRHVQIFASADNLLDRQYYLSYLSPGRTLNAGLRIRM